MALTQITRQVVASNAISGGNIANSAISSRHVATGAITADKLAANVSTIYATSISLDNVQSNLNAVSGGLSGANTVNTNQTTGLNGANTNITNLQTGLTGSNTRISATESNVITLQTFATSTQSNIASILNGSSQFTGNVILQRNLTVQGNLYVTGAQVDLAVGSTSIYDAIITLNANLSTSTPPPADSGILINRGNSDNVFIGTETTDPHIKFVYTNSPSTSTTIVVKEYIDIIANAFHANASSQTQPAFGSYSDQNTGVHFPQPDTLALVTGGIIQANVTSTGNLQLNTGYIQTAGTTFNSLDLRTTSMSNGISLRSVSNVGIFLDHDNNSSTDYFGVFSGTGDPSTAIDSAIFSIREQNANVYSKGNLNYISSNATTDVYSGNALISTRVFSSGVELRSNDYATYLAAQGGITGANANIYTNYLAATANDLITYTRLNANLNTVSSNTDSKLALSGGTMSGNIAMGAKYINNLANPVQAQDAATRSYVLEIAGGTILSPQYTTNISSGSSNVIAVTINTPTFISRTLVSLSGVFQTPTVDYVLNTGNNSIQYTVSSLPTGLTTVIQSWA